MKDLRSYLDQIAKLPGNLLTTDVPVDPKLELTRIIYKLEKQNKRPAVLFKKVRGSDLPVLTNLFGNRERLALALDTTEENLNQVYREREPCRDICIRAGAPGRSWVASGQTPATPAAARRCRT